MSSSSSSSTAALNPDSYRNHTASHNYYTILQLPNPFLNSSTTTHEGKDSIDDLVKQSYLRLVKLHHPDMTKHQHSPPHHITTTAATTSSHLADQDRNDTSRFVEIQEAYSVLKDEYTRTIYQAEVKAFIQLRRNPHYNPQVGANPYASSIHPTPGKTGFSSMFNGMSGYASSSSAAQAAKQSQRSFTFTSGGVFRKGATGSMLILLPIFGVGFLLLSIVSGNSSPNNHKISDGVRNGTVSSKHELVEAWLNPQSGRWETPAPWNPVYKKHLQSTPNSKVKSPLKSYFGLSK